MTDKSRFFIYLDADGGEHLMTTTDRTELKKVDKEWFKEIKKTYKSEVIFILELTGGRVIEYRK